MDIAMAIREKVGEEALRSNPNAVREWLYVRLGRGNRGLGVKVAEAINYLMNSAGIGEVECILTQLVRSTEERPPLPEQRAGRQH